MDFIENTNQLRHKGYSDHEISEKLYQKGQKMIVKPVIAMIVDLLIFSFSMLYFINSDTDLIIICLSGFSLSAIAFFLFLKSMQISAAVASEMEKINEYLKMKKIT